MPAQISHPKASSYLSIATILAVTGTLLVNTLSNIFPPGGMNVGEIANTQLKDLLILPANYAFAIWGLIYVGLIAYCVYQWNHRHIPVVRRVNSLLIVACVFQMVWIYLFTLRFFGWSILTMLGILIPLIAVYLQLGIGKIRADWHRRWMVHVPFSVYLGWISVATIVNVASALYIANWNGWGLSPVVWTISMVLAGLAIAAIMIVQKGDIAFALVMIWAYVAIALRQSSTTAISTTAIASVVVMAALLILRWLKKKPAQFGR